METFSTREAARRLGIGASTLSRYIAQGKVPAPKAIRIGGRPVHLWTVQQIERVRTMLPKIENGRHLRYQKLREAKSIRKRT